VNAHTQVFKVRYKVNRAIEPGSTIAVVSLLLPHLLAYHSALYPCGMSYVCACALSHPPGKAWWIKMAAHCELVKQ